MKSFLTKTLTTFLLLSALTTNFACTFPAFSAQYQLMGKNNRRIGKTERTLMLPGKHRFNFTSNTAIHIAFINDQIIMRSNGLINNKGLQPLHISMSEQRKNKQQSSRVLAQHFDVTTYPLQMRLDLQRGAKSFIYLIDTNGQSATHRFIRLPKHTLHTPMGNLDVITMQSLPINNMVTELMFAPSKNYLLVGTTQYKNKKIMIKSLISNYQPTAGSRCINPVS